MIQPLEKLKISTSIILEITIAILCTVKYSENKTELFIVLELQINKEMQRNELINYGLQSLLRQN